MSFTSPSHKRAIKHHASRRVAAAEPYKVDYLPEPGFPLQAEAALADGIPEELYNACGAMAAEALWCIAENRQPNYEPTDAPRIRRRMFLELFQGLWPRGTVDEQGNPPPSN